MTKDPKTKAEAPEGDPKEGDAILKRMLQMKPKPHKDMVKGHKPKREQKTKKV
jgi:hypothetical protein